MSGKSGKSGKSGVWHAAGLAAVLLWTGPVVAEGPFTWGADLRLRHTVIGNVGLKDEDPNADRTFQRYRVRLFGEYASTGPLGASARLVWEGRHYGKPDARTWPWPGFETWYSGGAFFDQLAIELKRPGGAPFTLKAGRQDLSLGDGWLVQDGTPIDGSRTACFDAVRLTFDAKSLRTTFDLVGLDLASDTGRFPSPLNGTVEDQAEQAERGLILWARNESLVKGGRLDAWVIYKDARPSSTPGNVRVNNGAPFPSAPDDGEVTTAGLRGELKGARWEARAEGALQGGRRNGRDLRAFGGRGRVTRLLPDRWKSRVHAGVEILSGDEPGSGDDEAFDPLWGRWPQWSELMIYQWPLDSRVGEATNLVRLNAGWAARLGEAASLTLDYHALWADEASTRTPAQAANLGGGRFRGHLVTSRLKTSFGAHVAAHLHSEYLAPGDFYAESRRDGSFFVRAELYLTY